jgi:hypothetical protein
MKILHAGVIFLFLSALSCDMLSDSDKDVTGDIENIQKCAIRYAINPSASPLNSYSSLYFIGIGKYDSEFSYFVETNDPSRELLDSLVAESYNVKKVSDGEMIFDGTHNGIYDIETGEQGVLIIVGEIISEKIDDSTITIAVENFLGFLFAEGYSYTMEYRNGTWEVIRVEMTWISK